MYRIVFVLYCIALHYFCFVFVLLHVIFHSHILEGHYGNGPQTFSSVSSVSYSQCRTDSITTRFRHGSKLERKIYYVTFLMRFDKEISSKPSVRRKRSIIVSLIRTRHTCPRGPIAHMRVYSTTCNREHSEHCGAIQFDCLPDVTR